MKAISVLIVDDNIAARKLLRSVLVSLNRHFVVYEAEQGAEAMRLNKTNIYDIIFLDIEMPGMNGFEVLCAVLKEIPDQFIVMVSANATIVNVKKTIELGGQGFIAKPFNTTKVGGAIDKYMKMQAP